MRRWLPQSLFSRMLLVMVTGLVLAQAASLAIYWRDRDEFMQRSLGMRSIRRLSRKESGWSPSSTRPSCACLWTPRR